MLRAISVATDQDTMPFDIVVLAHDERHLRRKLLVLQHGDEVLVDLPKTVTLSHGDQLLLEDGRRVEVIAAEEDLLAIRAATPVALLEVAWHLGNRHLPAQLEADRILIARDHVIEDMLLGLGASVVRVSEPFEPARGAYHQHGHAGEHSHAH